MSDLGRDRLRELLDAVLADDHGELGEMPAGAFSSPWHFSRQFSRGTGEPPVALRRRVMLERAAWQLRHGGTVTEVAFGSGYESVEGFSRAFARAFGYPPSSVGPAGGSEPRRAYWLPAPNGIHFHPPMHLWVSEHEQESASMQLVAPLVQHDVDDTTALIRRAGELTEDGYRRVRLPGFCDRQGRWGDRLIDALCEPPESFVLAHVVTHVITFAAHRRQLARQLLRQAGLTMDHGDPIEWLRSGATLSTPVQLPMPG